MARQRQLTALRPVQHFQHDKHLHRDRQLLIQRQQAAVSFVSEWLAVEVEVEVLVQLAQQTAATELQQPSIQSMPTLALKAVREIVADLGVVVLAALVGLGQLRLELTEATATQV